MIVIRPVEEDGNDVGDDWEVGKQLSQQASQAALEADELALLGLNPVKGLLLYGPVSKTLYGLKSSRCVAKVHIVPNFALNNPLPAWMWVS